MPKAAALVGKVRDSRELDSKAPADKVQAVPEQAVRVQGEMIRSTIRAAAPAVTAKIDRN